MRPACIQPFFKQRNQSRQYVPSDGVSIRCCATPHEPAGGMITSSPGCQLAGVAMPSASAFCSATMMRLISSKFLPVEDG